MLKRHGLKFDILFMKAFPRKLEKLLLLQSDSLILSFVKQCTVRQKKSLSWIHMNPVAAPHSFLTHVQLQVDSWCHFVHVCRWSYLYHVDSIPVIFPGRINDMKESRIHVFFCYSQLDWSELHSNRSMPAFLVDFNRIQPTSSWWKYMFSLFFTTQFLSLNSPSIDHTELLLKRF